MDPVFEYILQQQLAQSQFQQSKKHKEKEKENEQSSPIQLTPLINAVSASDPALISCSHQHPNQLQLQYHHPSYSNMNCFQPPSPHQPFPPLSFHLELQQQLQHLDSRPNPHPHPHPLVLLPASQVSPLSGRSKQTSSFCVPSSTFSPSFHPFHGPSPSSTMPSQSISNQLTTAEAQDERQRGATSATHHTDTDIDTDPDHPQSQSCADPFILPVFQPIHPPLHFPLVPPPISSASSSSCDQSISCPVNHSFAAQSSPDKEKQKEQENKLEKGQSKGMVSAFRNAIKSFANKSFMPNHDHYHNQTQTQTSESVGQLPLQSPLPLHMPQLLSQVELSTNPTALTLTQANSNDSTSSPISSFQPLITQWQQNRQLQEEKQTQQQLQQHTNSQPALSPPILSIALSPSLSSSSTCSPNVMSSSSPSSSSPSSSSPSSSSPSTSASFHDTGSTFSPSSTQLNSNSVDVLLQAALHSQPHCTSSSPSSSLSSFRSSCSSYRSKTNEEELHDVIVRRRGYTHRFQNPQRSDENSDLDTMENVLGVGGRDDAMIESESDSDENPSESDLDDSYSFEFCRSPQTEETQTTPLPQYSFHLCRDVSTSPPPSACTIFSYQALYSFMTHPRHHHSSATTQMMYTSAQQQQQQKQQKGLGKENQKKQKTSEKRKKTNKVEKKNRTRPVASKATSNELKRKREPSAASHTKQDPSVASPIGSLPSTRSNRRRIQSQYDAISLVTNDDSEKRESISNTDHHDPDVKQSSRNASHSGRIRRPAAMFDNSDQTPPPPQSRSPPHLPLSSNQKTAYSPRSTKVSTSVKAKPKAAKISRTSSQSVSSPSLVPPSSLASTFPHPSTDSCSSSSSSCRRSSRASKPTLNPFFSMEVESYQLSLLKSRLAGCPPIKSSNYRLQVQQMGEKGRGVVTLEGIEKGSYVCEYAGELIDWKEAEEREHKYNAMAKQGIDPGCYMFYCTSGTHRFCFDGTIPDDNVTTATYVMEEEKEEKQQGEVEHSNKTQRNTSGSSSSKTSDTIQADTNASSSDHEQRSTTSSGSSISNSALIKWERETIMQFPSPPLTTSVTNEVQAPKDAVTDSSTALSILSDPTLHLTSAPTATSLPAQAPSPAAAASGSKVRKGTRTVENDGVVGVGEALTVDLRYGYGRYMNHSRRRPNLKPKLIQDADEEWRLCFFAKHELKVGEELLIDYGDRDRETLKVHKWLQQY